MHEPAHSGVDHAPLPWIVRLRAVERLAWSVLSGVSAFVLLTWLRWASAKTVTLVAWNVGAWTYLILAALVLARADAGMTRRRVLRQDQSGYVIFLLVVGAAAASLGAIGFLLSDLKQLPAIQRLWHLGLSIAALFSSWLLIQMLFAFHYARRYYQEVRRGRQREPGGLDFPGGQPPDYLDFAYFSFVIGMTSQVSDVVITNRRMRRLALVHGILSFVFNIAILATSINIIASVI